MARQLFNRRHQQAIFKNQYGPNFIVPPFSLISSINLLLYHFSIFKSLCMWLGQEDDGRTINDLQNLTCKR